MDEPKKYISTEEAVEVAKEAGVSVSRPTIRKWALEYNIGRQLGVGRFVYDPVKLKEFLKGELDGK